MKDTFRNLSPRLSLAALIGAIIIAGSGFTLSRIAEAKEDSKSPPARLVVEEGAVNREGKATTSFAPVVKKVAPSVVKVFTTTKVKQMDRGGSPFSDDILRRFFGDQFDEPSTGKKARTQKQYGLGSGVLVTKDGYILTNNHVVDNADEVKVAMTDGREFTAKVIGKDPKTEVAILKIDTSDAPHLVLANSDKTEVGDLVLAVGNPFGVGQTVTMGIVSAIGRDARRLGMGLDYQDFIQTDAAINPGNSGGPLVDAEGRLLGINTFIMSRSGGNEGIGFAIPINLARSVMDSLIEHGRVIRGFLGVIIQDVNPNLAKEFGIEESSGALVADITPKSPAEKGGIKIGDVITQFNGKAVKDSRHLKLEVGQTAPDAKVPVKVLRDGKTRSLEVTLKELSDGDQAAKAEKKDNGSSDALDGVTVGDIDAAARSQFRGLPRDLKGALVTDVDEDSASYDAGLRPGDVILEINKQPVRNAHEAVEISENIKEKKTLLRVWSRGGSHYVVVDESKKH